MEDSLESSDRLIAHHRNQVNYAPPPPSTLVFAYGPFRYERMTKELSGTDDVLRTKALIEINEDFRQGYNIIEGVRSPLPEQLRRGLSDSNDNIRELASRAFVSMAKIKEAKDYLVSHQVIIEIARLFDDPCELIRKNSYDSLLFLSWMREGCEAVVSSGIIETLVDKIISEKTEKILVQVLCLIQQLLQVKEGPPRALNTPIISRTKKLLESVSSELRKLVAENLASLSFSATGKRKVIEEGCVVPLAKLLFDDIVDVRGAGLLALASLSIENAAKVELIEGQMLDRIMGLLGDESVQNRLNAIQLISNVAEHPVAKIEFQRGLDKLRDLMDSDNELLAKYAAKAIAVITWRP